MIHESIGAVTRVQGVEERQRLLEQYRGLTAAEPGLRAVDLAQRLGVSEAELVACREGDESSRLQGDFQTLLKSLEPLGEVMVLTRNPQAVHERKGVYGNVTFSREGRMGLVLAEEIDLRLFMQNWYCAFALEEKGRSSLQFFDAQGVAVHKIYATERTDATAWAALVERFRDPQPAPLELRMEAATTVTQEQPQNFDREAFRRDWAELKDVHDYHGMLRRHGLSRTRALREIGDKWSRELVPEALCEALQKAADRSLEIMIFVGNRGCVQIHTGPVSRLLTKGPWFNVLDERFNLHLRLDQLSEVWALTRPTRDGIVTSIEGFNRAGESVITLFGKRKPGHPELEAWRQLVTEVGQSSARESRSCA